MTDYLQAADIGSIVLGIIGAITNAFLLYVTVKQRAMNEKFAFLFKNLALNDLINAVAIPICWYWLAFSKDEAENFALSTKELTLLSVSLCTISVQHPLIALIGLLRYKILLGQGAFRKFSLRKTKLFVVIVWICCFVIPLLVYFVSLITDRKSEVLDILPRINSTVFLIGASCAITILLVLLIRMAKIIYFWPLPTSTSASIKKSLVNVFLFMLFTGLFSILPGMFCFEMIACGPTLNHKVVRPHSICSKARTVMFHDVKLEFSLMFLSLCLMSISNGTVFLLQPSLRMQLLKSLCCKSDIVEDQRPISAYVFVDPLDLMKQEIEDEREPSVLNRLRNVSSYGTYGSCDESNMPRSDNVTASMRSDN